MSNILVIGSRDGCSFLEAVAAAFRFVTTALAAEEHGPIPRR